MGDRRGQFSDCTHLGCLEQLLPHPLVGREFLAQSGHESVVLHGYCDLVGDQLGQTDEARLEDSFRDRINNVEEPHPPTAVVHEPDYKSGLDFRLEPREMPARDLNSNRMAARTEGSKRGAACRERFTADGPSHADD